MISNQNYRIFCLLIDDHTLLSVAKGRERELSTALWEWSSIDFNQGDIVLSINDVIHMCPMANRDDAVCNYAICNVCEEKHKSNRRAKKTTHKDMW